MAKLVLGAPNGNSKHQLGKGIGEGIELKTFINNPL